MRSGIPALRPRHSDFGRPPDRPGGALGSARVHWLSRGSRRRYTRAAGATRHRSRRYRGFSAGLSGFAANCLAGDQCNTSGLEAIGPLLACYSSPRRGRCCVGASRQLCRAKSGARNHLDLLLLGTLGKVGVEGSNPFARSSRRRPKLSPPPSRPLKSPTAAGFCATGSGVRSRNDRPDFSPVGEFSPKLGAWPIYSTSFFGCYFKALASFANRKVGIPFACCSLDRQPPIH
jgi:hypothetical protein